MSYLILIIKLRISWQKLYSLNTRSDLCHYSSSPVNHCNAQKHIIIKFINECQFFFLFVTSFWILPESYERLRFWLQEIIKSIWHNLVRNWWDIKILFFSFAISYERLTGSLNVWKKNSEKRWIKRVY
jgi:hypothetical protein